MAMYALLLILFCGMILPSEGDSRPTRMDIALIYADDELYGAEFQPLLNDLLDKIALSRRDPSVDCTYEFLVETYSRIIDSDPDRGALIHYCHPKARIFSKMFERLGFDFGYESRFEKCTFKIHWRPAFVDQEIRIPYVMNPHVW